MPSTFTFRSALRGRAVALLAGAVLLTPTALAERAQQQVSYEVGPNVRASAPGEGRNETWVAVSPVDPNLVIGVAQRDIVPNAPRSCATTVSRDGGQTWREIQLPDDTPGCFDPMVVATRTGRFYVMQTYISALSLPRAGARRAGTDGNIKVWYTDDGGITWTGPGIADCPVQPDHPRIIVDESGGPNDGRVYIAWNEVSDTFLKRKYHIFLHSSDDGGQTWSEPRLLDSIDGGKLVTTEPLVLSDGTLLVTYYQYFWPLSGPDNDAQPVWILRSEDGGETFAPRQEIARVGSSSFRHLRADLGRAFTLPIFAADASPESPYRDHLYMVWDDTRTGTSNIWFRRSTDSGHTWSEPVRLNRNAANNAAPIDLRVIPVVATAPDGTVGVAWYDRRDDPTRRCWHHYFTASLDGGATFADETVISTAASCPPPNTAPRVYVENAAPVHDGRRLTEEELAALPEAQQWIAAEEVGVQAAWRELSDLPESTLHLSFDSGRGQWPGHYTGLTGAGESTFRAFWADRRNGVQEIFTAEVTVRTSPSAAPSLADTTEVGSRVGILAGTATFDEAGGTATVELQLQNTSAGAIHAPLTVRLVTTGGGATVRDADMDGAAAVLDFSDLLGTNRALDPGEVSEALKVTLDVSPDEGLDGYLRFEIRGRPQR